MTRDAALAILRANQAELRRRGVNRASLFGSVARNQATPESDLDVMIEIDKSVVRDVYDYAGVIGYISDLFPVKVDVANRDMLKPYVRPSAERDAINAF
jgi:uncharacterized protein